MNDVTPLVEKLRTELRRRPLTGALVGSSSIGALLGRYFADGAVPVAEPAVRPSSDGTAAVVTGTVTYTGKDSRGAGVSCGASIVLTPAAGDVALLFTLTPPPGWTLPQLFPGVCDPSVSGLSFTSGGLVICSAPCREPGRQLPVDPGMTLVAELDLAASYPGLSRAFGAGPVLTRGAVTDPDVPVMTLVTEPMTAAPDRVPLSAATMTFGLRNLDPSGVNRISVADATLRATFGRPGTPSGKVTASLPAAGSRIGLTVDFDDVPLDSLPASLRYTGDSDLAASLPAAFSEEIRRITSAFKLSSLAIRLDTSTWRPLFTGVIVTVDLGGFSPFPGIELPIHELTVGWSLDFTGATPAVSFSAAAGIPVTRDCVLDLGMRTQRDGYLIFLSQRPGSVLRLTDVVNLFLDRDGFTLPTLTPASGTTDIEVTGLSVTLAPQDRYSVAVTVNASWALLERFGIEMAGVSIAADYASAATPALSGSVAGTLRFEVPPEAPSAPGGGAGGPAPAPRPIELDVSAVRPAGADGWILTGQTGAGQPIPVGHLIAALASKLRMAAAVPASLSSLTIENLSVQYDTGSENFTFGCQIDVAIDDTPVDMIVTVTASKDPGHGGGDAAYTLSFGGTLRVGTLTFDLFIDAGSTSTAIVAVYAQEPGGAQPASLHDLVRQLSPTAAEAIPADLHIALSGVKLILVKRPDMTELAIGVDLAASVGLSDLPLVGTLLPDTTVSISNLQAMYSGEVLDPSAAEVINNLLPKTVNPLPKAGLQPGFAFAGDLKVDGTSKALTAGVPGPAAAQPVPAQPVPAQPGGPPAVPTSAPGTHWLDVHKSFGPVSIGRLGVQYADNALMFLIDASLSLDGLYIGLNGLGLGSPLDHFTLTPHLDGLAISLAEGPVAVSGGFLAVPPPYKPDGVTGEYLGEVTIAVESLLISGVGAYATLNGAPSFFVFAEADGSFGGPPAFFVTGLMGGVGYNWALKLPAPDEVSEFPFLAQLGKPAGSGSGKPGPMEVLSGLSGQGLGRQWAVPAAGTNWLAAGVQFRSFELINGRVLLVAEMDAKFQLALLGLATISLPQDGAADPYAYAELQLEAVLRPSDGVFSAIAALTPKSYLMSKACQLTGGFAFCLWFGDSDHAGDFVFTIGGYHPAFARHDWYPAVPPVGLRWTVSDSLVISGSAYFAVTPSAIMAGGRLDVRYASGGLKAWLTAHANVMVRWRPFSMVAEIGISVGVSYDLKVGLISATMAAEVAASLTLWGPPAGGEVHVDWYVISFTINFGEKLAQRGELTVDWAGLQAMLPSTAEPARAGTGANAALAAGNAATDDKRSSAALAISVSRGLSGTDAVTGAWIVRPDELILTVASAIPFTAVTFGHQVTMPAGAPKQIGIRPMGESSATSTLTVTIPGLDLTKWPVPVVSTSRLPEALWGAPIPGGEQPAPAAELIEGLPTHVKLTAPPAAAGGAIGPVDPSRLVSALGTGSLPLTQPAAGSQGGPAVSPAGGAPPGQLLLVDHYAPVLPVGDYEVSAGLTVRLTAGGEQTVPNATRRLTVSGPRFALDPADIYSQHPPAASSGQFSGVLPHVIFTKRLLPWERALPGGDPGIHPAEGTPWLALLAFHPAELRPGGDRGRAASAGYAETMTVGKLLALRSGDVRVPRITADDAEKEMNCQVISIASATFARIVPTRRELPLLAHGREVDVAGKVLLDLQRPGQFSVLLANRFPQPGTRPQPGAPPVAAPCVMHVVSLEGFGDLLNGAAPSQPEEPVVKLVSLFSWTFGCLPDPSARDQGPGQHPGASRPAGQAQAFGDLARNLAFDGEERRPPGTLLLTLPPAPPAAQDGPAKSAADRRSHGYLALGYHARTGDDGLAWYRGPLAPSLSAWVKHGPGLTAGTFATAEAAMIFDQATGIFDLSLAAAWQCGRSLAVADRAFASALLRLRGRARAQLASMTAGDADLPGGIGPAHPALAALIRAGALSQMAEAATGGPLASPAASPAGSPAPAPVTRLRALLAEPPTRDALADGLDGNPDATAVASWLSHLILLDGVPFDHLIADARMLPSGSIRFGYLDLDWVSALIDGALSVGTGGSQQAAVQGALTGKLVTMAVNGALAARATALKQAPPDELPARNAAILIRSPLVTGWPGITVTGTLGPAQAPVPLLRLDVVRPDVLVALFAGVPDTITLEAPHEGLAFGVSPAGQITTRTVAGSAVTEGAPVTVLDAAGASKALRAGGARVLNVSGGAQPRPNEPPQDLAGLLTEALGASAPPVTAAMLALQLVRGPERLTFTVTPPDGGEAAHEPG